VSVISPPSPQAAAPPGGAAREARPRSRVVRNVLSNWSAFLFNAVVGFALSPILVHGLGDAAYGVWALLVSMVGYLGLLDLGVRGAVTRYVARYHATGDHTAAGRLASTALTIFVGAAALVIAVSTGLSFIVDHAFHIPSALVPAARIVVVLCGVNIAASLIGGVFGGIVTGLQRFDLSNGVGIGLGALRAVAIVLALHAGWGLVGLAAIQLAVTLATTVATAGIAARCYPELTLALGRWSREEGRTVLSFGASASLIQVMGSLVLYSDSVVIGALLPVEKITFFTIGASLTEYARSFVSGISYTVMPLASALEGRGEMERVRATVISGARIATLVVLPMVLTFMIRGDRFIDLWMGPAYGESGGRVLWVLSIALWAVAGYQVVTVTMLGINRHMGLIPGFVAEALANLALSIILIPRMGIVGSAWGTTIPRLIASLWFAPWFVQRVLGIPMKALWRDIWIKPTLAMLPFAAATYGIERLWPASNLAVYFGQVGLVLPVALAGAWLYCFTPEERRSWVRLVRRVPA